MVDSWRRNSILKQRHRLVKEKGSTCKSNQDHSWQTSSWIQKLNSRIVIIKREEGLQGGGKLLYADHIHPNEARSTSKLPINLVRVYQFTLLFQFFFSLLPFILIPISITYICKLGIKGKIHQDSLSEINFVIFLLTMT